MASNNLAINSLQFSYCLGRMKLSIRHYRHKILGRSNFTLGVHPRRNPRSRSHRISNFRKLKLWTWQMNEDFVEKHLKNGDNCVNYVNKLVA